MAAQPARLAPHPAERLAPAFADFVNRRATIKDLENWSTDANGERICLLSNGVPIVDREGVWKGYRGVDRNITERKRSEEALAQSHDLLMNAVARHHPRRDGPHTG